MKINTKVLLIILLISTSHIHSASFGILKKSANRNLKSNTSMNSSFSAKTNTKSKGINTSFYSVSTSITKQKAVTTSSSSSSSETVTRGGDLPDYNIYFDGWVKYLRYSDGKNTKPKAFFKNTRFAPETRAKFNGPEKDSVK
jgi:hypothetical protein